MKTAAANPASQPGSPPDRPRVPGRSFWICLVLAALTLAVYWPVTGYEFVNYDDTDFITGNPMIQAGVTARGLRYAMSAEVARNWHPVTLLSHILDCQLFGLNAGRHHLTSLLLHTANGLLLFGLLKRLTGAVWRSGMVAALFAWHPLHVESVAWIAERKDVLSAFFWWLTLWAYVRYGEVSKPGTPDFGRKRKLFYVLAVVLFALAVMSKPMVVTLPFVLLLLDFWPLGRFRRGANAASIGALVLEKLPFFALSTVLCVITFAVQKHGGAMMDTANLPLGSRFGNALVSFIRYPAKMLWPSKLAALYLRTGDWPVWKAAGAALALAGVTAWVVRQARTRPWLAFGWFWYAGTLVPVIGLVQVGMQSMADRYTYIPLTGLFIILSWGAAEISARLRPPKVWPFAAAAAALGACLLLTSRQITRWKDSGTLFNRMIDVTENNYIARYNLGNLWAKRKNYELAISNYNEAIAEQPIYADAHNNLAGILLEEKRYDEALGHYREALRLKPGFLPYFNLANALADTASARRDTNLFAQADETYRAALALNPDSGEAHHNFGLTLQAQQQDDLAIAEFEAAVRAQPDFEQARLDLAAARSRVGIARAMAGKMEEAARQFERVIQLNPRDSGAYGNLGNALGAQNKLDQAIACYLKALQINPADYQTEFNLGLSLLRVNRRDEAKAHFLAALRLHPGYPEALRALAEMEPSGK